MNNVCVCRSCVDPRENGLYVQHGLPLYNGIYMSRKKGAFIPKYDPKSDFSTTMSMLVSLGKNPTVFVQGHRDCAAVKVLYKTYGLPEDVLNDTEKEVLHSHWEALEMVKALAGHLSEENQLRILEKICVLQSVNNFLSRHSAEVDEDSIYKPVVFACFSMTPETPVTEDTDPRDIGLMIYNPAQNIFVTSRGAVANKGCRIVDLMDMKTHTPREPARFAITKTVDLEDAVRNEIRYLMTQTPRVLERRKVSSSHFLSIESSVGRYRTGHHAFP